MSYDLNLVIRGGTVVDGTGRPSFEADIGISDGRIVQVGQVTGRGAEEIDARGLLVTPGFVDVHTHYDAQVTWATSITPSSCNGVTTVLRAGGRRLMQRSSGYAATIVAGEIVLRDDTPTGALPGRLLRSGQG